MFTDHEFKRHSTSSSFETTAIVDPAFPSDVPRKRLTNLGNAPGPLRLKKSSSSSGFEVINQSVPWDVEEVLSDRPSLARRALAILAFVSILLVILGLGLGLGLTRSVDKSDRDDGDHIELEEPESASDFLEAHALFHDVLFEIQDETMLIADDNMQLQSTSQQELEFLPLATRYNLFTDFGMVRFFSGGETVRLNISCKTVANTDECAFVGVRFGLNGGSLRVMSTSKPIKITLPTDCAPETCAVVDLHLLGISADKETISSRPLYVRFGWTCEEEAKKVSCESDSCFASFASCNAVASTWPVEERFQLCLEQFGFEDKLAEIVDIPKGNCFDLEKLEESFEQCGRLVDGVNLSQIRAEERKKVDPSMACVGDAQQICGAQLTCDSYVVSKKLQRMEHSSPAPTNSEIVDTAQPTNSPTETLETIGSTLSPSVPTTANTQNPTSGTRSPTSSTPTSNSMNDTGATCHPSCSCPRTDPCCCRDGLCAADTCPESF